MFRRLTATTSIALGLAALSSATMAQPYDALSGVMVPPCGAEGEAVDAGTLGRASLGGDDVTAELVVGAMSRGEVCINRRNKLKFNGESAAMLDAGGSPDDAQPAPSQETTTAEETAPPPNPSAEPASPTATVESLANDLLNKTTDGDNRDSVVIPAQPAQTAVEETPEPNTPVAAAVGDDGRDAEPARVEETVVTEENSRSSSEEFDTQQSADAPSQEKKGGLSSFEKFALGAAGIVALDAIIGTNREVVSNSGDRVILRDQSGNLEVLRDDDTLLRRPGSEVKTETFSDGSTRSTVTRRNGSRIVTIADASGRVIKRTRITPDGREVLLIDDTEEATPVDVTRLPSPTPGPRFEGANDRMALQAALRAESRARLDRSFTLRQVRQYREVRDLMPEISIDAINFRSGSAAIEPDEAEELLDLGQALSDYIRENPDELFLVEGHTDAVGDAAYNLALSDRRAESVALALSEYFDVPPENMIIQGYGESELLVRTDTAERANRRAVVRRVTPLLR